MPLVTAFHETGGSETDATALRAAVAPLLQGTPHGVAYLIGPRRAPIGHIVISFGYSIRMGGIDGRIDEFFVRDKLRGRGIGGEVLAKLLPALAEHGVRAIHLEVGPQDRARRLYARAGFRLRDDDHLLTRMLD